MNQSPADNPEKPVSLEKPANPSEDRSFAELVRANLGWLRGWLGARMRGREQQEIDDLCQDILLRALRGRAMLRRPESFPGWLYRIAGNIWRDYLRKKKRSKKNERLVEMPVEPADPRNLEAEIDRQEELDRTWRAVLDLPEVYREPMILRHVQDLSYAEIARILGLNENTVQVRIFRARQLVRRLLSEARLSESPGGEKKIAQPSNRRETIMVW